jgi:hypothetical protein
MAMDEDRNLILTHKISVIPAFGHLEKIAIQRCPHFVRSFFPGSKHLTFKSEKAAVVGQGELKKLVFDPLFCINHAFAMLQANINRLFRRTWCTTTLIYRPDDHVKIFVFFYNSVLRKIALSPINEGNLGLLNKEITLFENAMRINN